MNSTLGWLVFVIVIRLEFKHGSPGFNVYREMDLIASESGKLI